MAEEKKPKAKKETPKTGGDICIIRIRGQIGVRRDVEEAFTRMRLRKKYACVVVKPTKENLGTLKKLRDFVAFGEISPETYKKLVEKRGKKDKDGNLKKFFRLHPARGGMKTKFHYPKGVLGDNKDKINDLVERML